MIVITFDFRADDIDERGEERRRAQEADPVAVAHLARLSGAGETGQGGHLCHFLVATAAVIPLLDLRAERERARLGKQRLVTDARDTTRRPRNLRNQHSSR